MIKTHELYYGTRLTAAVQFSTRQFAIGYSWEWGHTLFVFLGPVILLFQKNAVL